MNKPIIMSNISKLLPRRPFGRAALYLGAIAVGLMVFFTLAVAETAEDPPSSSDMRLPAREKDKKAVDVFIKKLNVLVRKSHPDQSLPFINGEALEEKTALKHVFDRSILTSDNLYDIDGLPQPPPPDTSFLPMDIREAMDESLIDVSVVGTGERSSLKLEITNRDRFHWQLIGIPVGVQFRPRAANVQSMGVR